jgi:hypothetical protein
MDAVEPETWQERLKKFNAFLKRNKRPAAISISAAGRIGIPELIAVIEKEYLRIL